MASNLPRPPNRLEVALAQVLLAPWYGLTAPVFQGFENVPRQRPVLFVGNHTIMGVLDIPVMAMGLRRRLGITCRFLGDHAHFAFPLWRDLLVRFGTVDGTRENARALMRAGAHVLVFPGGGREVFKRRGEKYRLLWKRRIGFVRLAVEFGYPIVPFSAVGGEECYEILLDGNDLLRSPLGPWVRRLHPRPDLLPPLVRGLGPTWLPRPQRFYFRFGAPIATTPLADRERDDAACFALREKVRAAVEEGIEHLLAERRRDPQRFLATRLLGWPQRLRSS